MTVTTDIDKLRELAVKADKEAKRLPFDLEKWLLTIKAHITILEDDLISEKSNEIACVLRLNVDADLRPEIQRLLDALEAANKRIAELETVNSNLKDDVRRGRRIIADLEEHQE